VVDWRVHGIKNSIAMAALLGVMGRSPPEKDI
jgi:hypothetical protein